MSQLQTVHICKRCGQITLRTDMTTSEIVSGIFHCQRCDHFGPLNLEIVDFEKGKSAGSGPEK